MINAMNKQMRGERFELREQNKIITMVGASV